jgi:hypothetical protein
MRVTQALLHLTKVHGVVNMSEIVWGDRGARYQSPVVARR